MNSKIGRYRFSLSLGVAICTVWLTAAFLGAVTVADAQVRRMSDGSLMYENATQVQAKQQTEIAVIDEQIKSTSRSIDSMNNRMDSWTQQVNDIHSDIATMKGVGIGIGFLLGFLQTIQVILQVRKRREEEENMS